ncbi:uncharacterized protein [Diabrotica undecimpunctata]|uniref:uncharacterized protein n=1 Tax=Diabrotica undecimpunctata TaxID=50387 RepID=UPI003B63270D
MTETTIHSVHTICIIETYDASKNYDRWLQCLQSSFNVFAVLKDKKAAYLLHYMGPAPDAYDILCDKISTEKPDEKSYYELVNTMKLHYNPEPLEIVENFRFSQRKQHEGKSTNEYITALRRLATTCKFGDYLNKALRNQFVFGFRNQNIQSRLLEYKHLTMEKALEMETSNRDAARLQKSNTSANINKVSSVKNKQEQIQPTNVKRNDHHNQTKNIFCYRCGSSQHIANKCNKKHLVCSKCKRGGHLSKVCKRSAEKNKS